MGFEWSFEPFGRFVLLDWRGTDVMDGRTARLNLDSLHQYLEW